MGVPDSWVILYNANLDRALGTRHTPDQLRQELRKMEDAEQREAGSKNVAVADPIAYQVRGFPSPPSHTSQSGRGLS